MKSIIIRKDHSVREHPGRIKEIISYQWQLVRPGGCAVIGGRDGERDTKSKAEEK